MYVRWGFGYRLVVTNRQGQQQLIRLEIFKTEDVNKKSFEEGKRVYGENMKKKRKKKKKEGGELKKKILKSGRSAQSSMRASETLGGELHILQVTGRYLCFGGAIGGGVSTVM